MPRIGQKRSPAIPATSTQQQRCSAILGAATRLGISKEIDLIQAHEIAAEADVALRTLYRYYPTKQHVFAAVLDAQVHALQTPRRTRHDPAEAVSSFVAATCRNMLQNKNLAHAMITSTQAVRASAGSSHDYAFREKILEVAGIQQPTSDQIRIARLVEQVTFGILTWTVGGALDPDDAADDVGFACRRLIGDTF
jgi:TetR/AcrR family transcriptional regulator, cholesterol catabolism regulator